MTTRRRCGLGLVLALGALCPARARAQGGDEALWYLTSRETSVQSFLAHADRISIVAPQTFSMDSNGVVWGSVDERVMATAKAKGIRVIPLIVNEGFDQPEFHRFLASPTARARAVGNIAALCHDNGYAGIQFDFENVHVVDRDAFSAFTRDAAAALHGVGCSLSVAVVPRTSDFPGPTSYHKWIFDYWRGVYDYRALAEAADFLSLMTYDEHTHRTPPGPVAGVPWMERVVEFLLKQGVPPSRISLGIPSYSDWWYPAYDPKTGAAVSGRQLPYPDAMGVLARNGVKPVWDPTQQVSWAFWQDDGINQFVFLEDARSFQAKLKLVKKFGLRGYSVWVLGSEDPAIWSLVRGGQALR
jgi:spore germination protein YaaH